MIIRLLSLIIRMMLNDMFVIVAILNCCVYEWLLMMVSFHDTVGRSVLLFHMHFLTL